MRPASAPGTAPAPPRPTLVDKLPALGRQAAAMAVPALLTALLAYLLAVRFDRSGLPPCNPVPPLNVMGSVCGFALWNPEDLALVPSLHVLVTIRFRPRLPTSPADDRVPVGLFALQLPDPNIATGEHGTRRVFLRPPTHLWPIGRPSDVGRVLTPETCSEPPREATFHPHALSAAPATGGTVRLFVLASSEERKAVEWFDIATGPKGTTVAWVGCTPLPPNMVANRIHALANNAFLVTTSAPLAFGLGGLRYAVALAMGWLLGQPTGDVRRWHAGEWHVVPKSETVLPTGVLALGDAIFVSEQGLGRICRLGGALAVTDGDAGEVNKTCVDVGGAPSGLSVVPLKSRAVFTTTTEVVPWLVCLWTGRRSCPTSFSVRQISLRSLKTHELIAHNGTVLGAASSVVEWAGGLYIGAALSDRVGIYLL